MKENDEKDNFYDNTTYIANEYNLNRTKWN